MLHFLSLISADGSPAPPLPHSPILASEVQGRLFLDLHYTDNKYRALSNYHLALSCPGPQHI